jgi:enoyl-CoA hydratase
MAKWLKTCEFIKFDVKQRVARITLNRPDKRNALSTPMLQELHDALWEADDRTDVNVMILEGAGKDFCAGYDLVSTYTDRQAEEQGAAASAAVNYRSQMSSIDDDCWQLETMQRRTMTMFEVHKPVIAKVQGNCLAGGSDLALMCDVVIAAEEARIGFPATRANGTPPNHMWFYHVGPQWAKRLLLTGDCVSGRDAVKIGLVLDAVPAEQLDEEVNELARRMSFIDADLLAAQKRVVNMALELSGSKTLQRFAAESDARAHLCSGPRRTQFKQDMATQGLKQALKNRDEPFGDGMVKINSK